MTFSTGRAGGISKPPKRGRSPGVMPLFQRGSPPQGGAWGFHGATFLSDARRNGRACWSRTSRAGGFCYSVSACGDRKGFSLLELILVMLIMAAILALAAPSLRGFTASRRVSDVAASFVSLTKWARLKAVSEGRPYRLNIDLDYREYWLTAQVGANFEEIGESFGKIFVVPDEIGIEWVDSPVAEQRGYLEFDTGGRTDPASLRLIGKLGTVLMVTCLAPTEPYVVEHRPEEEYRYE